MIEVINGILLLLDKCEFGKLIHFVVLISMEFRNMDGNNDDAKVITYS